MKLPNVKVYSTPACPYCKMLKQFLSENDIKFENIDIVADKQAAEQMINKSGQMGVPVIEIDGLILVGFNKAKIKELLGI